MMKRRLIAQVGDGYVLAVPLSEAVSFALGWLDLGYDEPPAILRRIVGSLAVDALQYSEQWRAAAFLGPGLHARFQDIER
jgi:hypothetical protein